MWPNLAREDDWMPSPSPGMDPYLEHPGFWRDFHQRFIIYWCDWLADNLPEHYSVRVDERLGVVAERNGGGKTMLPDLSISQAHPLPEKVPASTAVATLDREPVTLGLE